MFSRSNRYLFEEPTDLLELSDVGQFTVMTFEAAELDANEAVDDDFQKLTTYYALKESAERIGDEHLQELPVKTSGFSEVPRPHILTETNFYFQPFCFFSGGISVKNETSTLTNKAYKSQQKLINQREKLSKLLYKKLDTELGLMDILENHDRMGFIKLQIQVYTTLRTFDLKHQFDDISPELVELNIKHLTQAIAEYTEHHGDQLPTAQDIAHDPALQAIQALVKEFTGKALYKTDARESIKLEDAIDQESPPSIISNPLRRNSQIRLSKSANASNEQAQFIEAYFSDFIGLQAVREEIKKIVSFLQVQHLRAKQGFVMKSPTSRHMVFTGNPGTGKTEMARLIAKIMYDKGIVTEDIFIEADRSDLIAEYLGQTAIKTKALIEESFGGVLFIDEAYTLKTRDDDMYGDEAIATLLKMMEDHRDKVTVIVAGYQDEMQTFIESNPGLKSRFNRYVDFPDYDDEELFEILLKMAQGNHYQIVKPDEIKPIALSQFNQQRVKLGDTFANARTVRNYFEKVIEQQSLRVVNLANADLNTLTVTDFYI